MKNESGQKVEVQHGRTTGWHRNGQKNYSMTFDKGKIVGVAQYWHDNGQPSGIDYHDENGLLSGISEKVG